jgi:hypothetical protein
MDELHGRYCGIGDDGPARAPPRTAYSGRILSRIFRASSPLLRRFFPASSPVLLACGRINYNTGDMGLS